VALYLLYRGIRDRRYFGGLRERLGFLPPTFHSTGAEAVWLHAVSVGEVLTALPLIHRLRQEKPFLAIYVSVTTLAGRSTADEKLAGVADGVFFAPLDYRSAVRRVLRRLRPHLVIVLETEIWPNFYREAKRAGAALVVVNGRISDRAFPRYRSWRKFFRHVLVWPDAILVQTEEDRRRYLLAGAPEARVRAAGNLKYDFTPPAGGIAPEIAPAIDRAKPGSIWIAASTMPPADADDIDEDDAVLQAFEQMVPWRGKLLLILAPRKPERFAVAAEKLQHRGIAFTRRSELTDATRLDLPGVLLLDTIGELAALFARADVVFMGGTLARRGGHNILEPAHFGKPIIVGPHMENFAEIAAEFRAAGAVRGIDEAGALGGAVGELLDREEDARALGHRAWELAGAKRGVVDRVAVELLGALREGVPSPARTLIARLLLTPLSWAWRAGMRARLARRAHAQRSLDTPVISIGALSMGGAGKTPLVAHLAQRLHEAGRDPAILTRGYRRRSPGKVVIAPRGEKTATDVTGDEAQILLRAGHAHVGIGGDRYAVGRRVEEALHPGVFLLDDGFQHVQLARRHDLVLVDALDPLAGGVFPLGRLREPIEHLQRATAIVLTRVAPRASDAAGRSLERGGLERLLTRYNAQAPIFRSRVVPLEWVDLEWGTVRPTLDTGIGACPEQVAAFCGLGNPDSFWRTLEELGIEIAFRWAFGDHHRYQPAQLKRLARQAREAGVETLVTTEKDVMNLCGGAAEIVRPLKILWLRIGVEIEDEEKLLRLLA
jgi:3-deoxy-D-manno-octulosonic-acid transferase